MWVLTTTRRLDLLRRFTNGDEGIPVRWLVDVKQEGEKKVVPVQISREKKSEEDQKRKRKRERETETDSKSESKRIKRQTE